MTNKKDDIKIDNEKVETEEKEEVKNTDWKEQFLRVNADLQNFKRRIEKDRSLWVSTAQVKVMEALLPLIDEFDLAISSSEKQEFSQDVKTWLDGFKMIQKNFKKRLADLGVKEIDCSGKFDPNLHEALMQVDSADHKSGEIVSVLSPGYLLGKEIIRHAKVSVAK
ncbi:nucleotide exchange factor GrpE [Candidatus Babeliales bacterium]|nr:nucleotide exchange factor GrpE [Candidatus Babeliales bacterium]